MEERERRIGLNEAVFREVNERLKDVNETFGTFSGVMSVICECGTSSCIERLSLPVAAYEGVRAEPDLFIVAPGHEQPTVEDVVDRRGKYDVVRKRPGPARELAEEADPRS